MSRTLIQSLELNTTISIRISNTSGKPRSLLYAGTRLQNELKSSKWVSRAFLRNLKRVYPKKGIKEGDPTAWAKHYSCRVGEEV
jgi:hypothetical protein